MLGKEIGPEQWVAKALISHTQHTDKRELTKHFSLHAFLLQLFAPHILLFPSELNVQVKKSLPP